MYVGLIQVSAIKYLFWITGGHPQVSASSTSLKVMVKPNPSTLFTGQKTYLDMLKQHFKPRVSGEQPSRHYFLLYGMGGIGKTQICLKFIEEVSNQYVLSIQTGTSIEFFVSVWL